MLATDRLRFRWIFTPCLRTLEGISRTIQYFKCFFLRVEEWTNPGVKNAKHFNKMIIRFHRESLRDSNANNDWRPYVALDIWRVQGPGTIKIHTRCGSWSGKPKDRPCWEEIDGIWSEDIPPLNCKEEYMCPAHGSFWQDLHVSV